MSKREREGTVDPEVQGHGDGASAADDSAEQALKKPKASAKSKTLTDKIVEAIRTLRSPTGSSAQAIQKVILTFNGSPTAFKNALKKALEKGVILKNKNSYMVVGDPVYEDTSAKVDVEDISPGEEGESVSTGDTCVISYVGTLQSTGKRFDRSKAFSFTVGGGEVIKGMDKGIRGMKIGARRRLVIPPSLGYGKRGSPPDIPPDATLCFDIKLIQIRNV